jgi:hypothetical protein
MENCLQKVVCLVTVALATTVTLSTQSNLAQGSNPQRDNVNETPQTHSLDELRKELTSRMRLRVKVQWGVRTKDSGIPARV